MARHAHELAPKGVIQIHNGVLKRFPRKEPRLGASIGRHGAVVIEMVAGKIGEHRHVELNAGKPPLLEAVRRHFHHCCSRAFAVPLREFGVQHGSVRSGVGRDFHCVRKTVAQRAGDHAVTRGLGERTCDPLCARGLAVSAGHTHRPQARRGAPAHMAGHRTHLGAQAAHRPVFNARAEVPLIVRALPQHG